jgi:hypothetical protein
MCEVEQVRAKYARLRGVMDERVTRLWAATEAEALGYGGIAAVVKATGISKSRIRAGLRDLAEEAASPSTEPARGQRVRRPGAGRPALVEVDPTLLTDLEGRRRRLIRCARRRGVGERRERGVIPNFQP